MVFKIIVLTRVRKLKALLNCIKRTDKEASFQIQICPFKTMKKRTALVISLKPAKKIVLYKSGGLVTTL